MAGLSEDGFEVETFDEIREGMNDDMRSLHGPSIDVSNGSIEGNTFALVSVLAAELWEGLEAVYNSLNPDTATGAAQDSLAALTGTQRNEATPSTVTLTLTGDAATLVPAGSQASVTDSGALFETLANATITALTAWVTLTVYAIGNRRTNAGNAYIVTTGGTSGATGPTTTDEEITDGSVIWRFLGVGAAAVDVAAECTEDGPTIAVSGSVTVIETPVSGWDGVINLLDADLGSNVESDEDLRIRRETELASPGSSPIDALRAELLDVVDVDSVTVFMNTTDTTDADGVPPHAVECLVAGGADQDIWDALLASVAAGIETYGDEVGASVDSSGNSHTMAFSRQEEILVYVEITLIKDPNVYPEDGDDQVKAAIVAFGDAQKPGKDVVASSVGAQAFSIPGVLDVTTTFIDDAPSPTTSTTIPVTLRQIGVFDTSRIDVITTNGTP